MLRHNQPVKTTILAIPASNRIIEHCQTSNQSQLT